LIAGALGLLWLGALASGAASDRIVPIDGVVEPCVPDIGVIWEQPPIERDVSLETPLFCGWDEPAYAEEMPNATQKLASCPADDFRCVGSMPITGIQWWGSFKKWQQTTPPAIGPDAWRITFSANTPAEGFIEYSRPGNQLSQFEVSADQVTMEYVGSDRFPNQPQDSCFRCSLTLDAANYFWPSMHDGDIFWIGIAAVYKTQRADYAWGWKTRPQRWMDGAVKYVSDYEMLPSGQAISGIVILPVEGPDACGQTAKYDMAFALYTDSVWIKWAQPFTGLRHWSGYEDEPSTAKGASASSIAIKWQQKPDMGSNGLDMDATADTPKTWPAQILADDYECKISGPVTQIWIWGSYYLDDLPGNDPCNVQFTLSIRADVPAANRAGSYSMPGKVLWTKTFKKGQFAVQESKSQRQSFFSPCNAEYTTYSHTRAFKYTFTVDPGEAFIQGGTSEKPLVYWLSVQAQVTQSAGSKVRFGWKTSTSFWNDDAVSVQAQEPYSGTWQKLNYPAFHPRVGQHTALAFAIITSDQSTAELIDRQVADDWQSQGLSPVVAAAWWGSYKGYTDTPCECTQLVKLIKPDYFLLSIWSDVLEFNLSHPSFNHPGQKLWEYRAYQYNEVQVGADKDPEPSRADKGHEPVFRYSVKLPYEKWFTPEMGNTYWFSIVAVYQYPKVASYPWGWTNHEHTFNADAVAGSESLNISGKESWAWESLKDQTGVGEDASFVLFQQVLIDQPAFQLP
jgi:hypothetical protein